MATKEFKKNLREQTFSYMTGALGLVAGLAWNDAIKSLIEILFPLDASSVWVKFIYAVLITVVVVIFSQYIFRLLAKEEPKEGKNTQ